MGNNVQLGEHLACFTESEGLIYRPRTPSNLGAALHHRAVGQGHCPHDPRGAEDREPRVNCDSHLTRTFPRGSAWHEVCMVN